MGVCCIVQSQTLLVEEQPATLLTHGLYPNFHQNKTLVFFVRIVTLFSPLKMAPNVVIGGVFLSHDNHFVSGSTEKISLLNVIQRYRNLVSFSFRFVSVPRIESENDKPRKANS
jgi:hypothetical protein